jgi:putative transposase
MTAQQFTIGANFLWLEKPYEITRVLPGGKATIEHHFKEEVRTVAISELVKAVFAGDLTFFAEGRKAKTKQGAERSVESKYLSLDECQPHLVEIAKFRYKVIEPLLKIKGRKRKHIEDRVKEVRKEFEDELEKTPSSSEERTLLTSVSATSIYRWLKYWREGGEDLRALIPETENNGGKRKTRLDQEVLKIVDQVIDKMYFKRELVTIDDVCNEVATTIEDENNKRTADEKMKAPSRSAVVRRIEALDLAHKFAAKHGKRAANLHLKQYGQMEYPEWPLMRVEIDHTRSDLIVIDDKDNLPLGRLTLTYCFDTATKYPLGYYLGFEPYSYYAVMECLYHAIRPKENVKEQYGTEHDWIAHGVPYTLVVDNGRDFVGKDLQDACLLLGIILERNPVRSPYLKAGVERLNRTSNTMFFHTFPGTTFSNIQKRGDYDSMKEACIYLSDIDKLMHLFIVDKYAERFHRGLGGIPARRWESALEAGFEPRVPESAEQLEILLSRVEYRDLWHYGVDFESIRYNAPGSGDLALLRTRLKGDPVKIKCHPGNVSYINVFDPFEEKYIELKATGPYQEYTQDLSLWKHRVIREAILQEKRSVDPVALGRTKRKMQEIVNAGRERRRVSTRTRGARWDTAGKPTRELNNSKQEERDNQKGQTKGSPPNLPQLVTPLLLPPGVLETSIEEAEREGWSIERPKAITQNERNGK